MFMHTWTLCCCCCSVVKSAKCLILCNPMCCSMPGFPVTHHLLEFAQPHIHWVHDAIQPSHPLSSPSPPAFSFFQHQGFIQWVSSLHQVASILEHQCESATGVHVSPHPEPPPILSHPIPLGCPSALALSALLHASNLHWSSILHMVIHKFQLYSLKSSHPHLLPPSPKVCSLHLCLFCCLAYRVFLNFIYMSWYTVLLFLFLTYLLCIMGSSFIHLIRTNSNVFFLVAE